MPTTKPKPQPCFECSGTLKHKAKILTVQYKGESAKVKVTGQFCSKCSEGILKVDALQQLEAALGKLKSQVDGILSPGEIKAIRKKLKLSQANAGALIGGGPAAFQKYEAGTVLPAVSMSNLLRLLRSHPEQLQELAGGANDNTTALKRAKAKTG